MIEEPVAVESPLAAINRDAGQHTVPSDPEELALALRAAARAWQMFPYLHLRFGERGERFTHSDSCWLVTLNSRPTAEALAELDWLRRVLVPRGLPTMLLEAHLRLIQAEFALLSRPATPGAQGYDAFLRRGDAERARWNPAVVGGAVDRADAALRRTTGLHVPSAAALVASAWEDERSGIAGGLAATRTWFTDGGRFSPEWIHTVQDLVAALDAIEFA